jgi:hypothetical protein
VADIQVVEHIGTAMLGGGLGAITTNKALDPDNGWKFLVIMEVKNPCVGGSMGYIFILEKQIS